MRPADSSTSWKCSSAPTAIAEDASAALELEPAECEVLAAEARAFAARVSDRATQQRYVALAEAADTGHVPPELVGSVEALLDLLLQRGRPLAEPVLLGIFGRTPRGRELAEATRDVNGALRGLYGQPLQTLRLTATPGRYALVVETDRVRLTLVVDGAGPRIESVETGGS